jgi:hypothetical protein
MLARALAIVALFLCAAPARAQQPEVYSYRNITTDTTTVVKSGPGYMHSICLNSPAATATIVVYDSTAGSGQKIATITSFASVVGCLIYDTAFWQGLTIVTATAAPDITVSFR